MTPDNPATMADALRTVLALPPADQARLVTLLQRVLGAAREGGPDPVADTALATEDSTAAAEGIEDWLRRIAHESPALRLQLLEDALAVCAEEDSEVLQSARTQLLRAHPPLALRCAVTAFASVHPASVAIALVGLLLAVIGGARLALRALF